MRAVKTKNSNHNFGPPHGRADDVDNLPCEITERDGDQVVRSVWVPSDEERKAIAEGMNIELDVWWIGAFAPVSINVTDEQKVD